MAQRCLPHTLTIVLAILSQYAAVTALSDSVTNASTARGFVRLGQDLKVTLTENYIANSFPNFATKIAHDSVIPPLLPESGKVKMQRPTSTSRPARSQDLAGKFTHPPGWVEDIDRILGIHRHVLPAERTPAPDTNKLESYKDMAVASKVRTHVKDSLYAPVRLRPDEVVVGDGRLTPKAGLQVQRGPHWEWGDQDGGIGSVGTIVDNLHNGWCSVRWASGDVNGYRVGHAARFDLRLASAKKRPPSHLEAPSQASDSRISQERKTSVPQAFVHFKSRGVGIEQAKNDAQAQRQSLAGPRPDLAGVAMKSFVPRLGLLVRRGPDWKWGDQDGGSGSVGTIIEHGQNGWATVRWPSGQVNGYRVGDGSSFDLRVASEGPRSSNRIPTVGTVQKATKEIALPSARAQRLEGVVSYNARPGLLVRRGPDWNWGFQDGGGVGKIVGIPKNGWANVQWTSGVENGYRVGAGGKYDLQYTTGSQSSRHSPVAAHERPTTGCPHRPRTRCWCIDQFGDKLLLS